MQNTTKQSIQSCAVKGCHLVNDSDLLAKFSSFYLPLSHMTPSLRGLPSSYQVYIWYEKIRMAGVKCGESRMMIDSVINRQT